MIFLQRLFIKIHKYRIILLLSLFTVAVVLFIYFFGVHYLNTIIGDTPQAGTTEENISIAGDAIILNYIKESGVIIEYSAERTQTDDNIIINAYTPRLKYSFTDKTKVPIDVLSDFSVFNQDTKIVKFEGNVFLTQENFSVHTDLAFFYLDTDIVVLPEGGTIKKEHTLIGTKIEWNILTNALEVENPVIYIF